MAAKIITIAALKGGSSRSTLATNLAGAISQSKPTLLVDLDTPQYTSASWVAVRQENNPAAAPALIAKAVSNYEDLVPVIQHQEQGFVVIDTAPRLQEASRAAILIADLVLVPCSPDVATIWALQDTLDVIKEAHKQRPSIKARLVWVRVRQTSTTSALQATATQEFKSIKAMRSSLGYRQSYQTALGNGTTVLEQNKDRLSKKELSELVAEVLTTIR